MTELNETQRYLVEEDVEEFQAGVIPRRELLRRVTYITGSIAASLTVLAALGCNVNQPTGAGGGVASATAARTPSPILSPSPVAPQAFATPPAQQTTDGITVKADDPRIIVSRPDVRGADGASLMAYMARPAGTARVPGVIVIHENRGQTEHIRDVVRRVATAGFMGINIDLVARAGGAERLTDQAAFNAELGKLTPAGKLADHGAVLTFLKAQSTGMVGVVGFCFGGGEVWSLVVAGADLKAAAPFYGPQPANFAEIAKTKTAVSAVYAEQDARISGSAPGMEAELKKSGTPYLVTIYPGVGHAFHNDTNTASYNAVQAQKAWVATIDWFRKYLA